MKKFLLGLICVIVLGTRIVGAAPIMYVHDSTGVLGKVDVVTGSVDVIGNMGVVLTDIAFNPTGFLFGLSFTDFYSINPETASTTLIGSHSVLGGNALVFSEDGTLYAAGSSNTDLYTINPSSGASTALGNMGFASGGDLAFNDGNFYLASEDGQLVRIDLSDLSNTVAVGPFGTPDVFGLATGDDGLLYGVGGTQIFTVNTLTGAATNPVNYGGQGLGNAFGQGFFTEAGAEPPVTSIPEPATLALLGIGLAGLGFMRRRRT